LIIHIFIEDYHLKFLKSVTWALVNIFLKELIYYSLRLKLYDVLGISHILKNGINVVWKRDIMSCFIKLSLINNIGKINERIEIRGSNK